MELSESMQRETEIANDMDRPSVGQLNAMPGLSHDVHIFSACPLTTVMLDHGGLTVQMQLLR